MKSNKGFTLIELLAVIVILAIIALIATPTILGVIDTARKGAAESSALGYIDAIEKQVAIDMLEGGTSALVPSAEPIDVTTISVKMKGEAPSAGTINFSVATGTIESADLTMGKEGSSQYCVRYRDGKAKAEGGACTTTSAQ